jgi:hypothetical protein
MQIPRFCPAPSSTLPAPNHPFTAPVGGRPAMQPKMNVEDCSRSLKVTVPIASLNGQAYRWAVWQDLKATALTLASREASGLAARQNERAGRRAFFRLWPGALELVQCPHMQAVGCGKAPALSDTGCCAFSNPPALLTTCSLPRRREQPAAVPETIYSIHQTKCQPASDTLDHRSGADLSDIHSTPAARAPARPPA